VEYFVIGDEDTVLGFRYAGVAGAVVTNPDEARDALAEQIAAQHAGVIIVTDEIANSIKKEVTDMQMKSRFPLIVQIPGPGGPAEDRPDMMSMIRESMGIKIE
jgi:V/A-type H+/Na+-transporting ATPase subunit F